MFPEEREGDFKKRLNKGIQASAIIESALKQKGWIVQNQGLGQGSDKVLDHKEASESVDRFKADCVIVQIIEGLTTAKMHAEFKGSTTGNLWINRYQFERMDPELLIIVANMTNGALYYAYRKDLELLPRTFVLRHGYSGAESRVVYVFQFKDLKTFDEF
jgi:hypothetical protein